MINLPVRPPPAVEPPPVVDLVLIRQWVGFAAHALRRHKLRALFTFALVTAAGVAALWAMPRSYHVEAVLLAQPNLVMPALGNPGRAIPGEADAPTRAASETVLRRENLVELIRSTDLIREWERTRAPATRLKDALIRALKGPPTEEERVDAMVGLLENRLQVITSDRTVRIQIDWPDPELAYRLVDAAQQNFLEARHASELASIQESIDILQTHAASVRDSVDEAYDAFRALQRTERTGAPAARVVRRSSSPSASPQPSRELEQLRSQLVAKQRALADLEDFRKRRMTELQAQLTEQRATYGPRHPVILALQQSIDQLQQDSPQVLQLKQDLRRIDAQIADLPPSPEPARSAPVRERERARDRTAEVPSDRERQSSPALDMAEERLRAVQGKYDELQGRIEAARIELDTARAAFKYRYSVVTPAQVPKRPQKPKVPVTVAATLMAAGLLALGVALWADLAGGKLVEPWQIERELHLPVLAEVSHP